MQVDEGGIATKRIEGAGREAGKWKFRVGQGIEGEEWGRAGRGGTGTGTGEGAFQCKYCCMFCLLCDDDMNE